VSQVLNIGYLLNIYFEPNCTVKLSSYLDWGSLRDFYNIHW